MINSKRTRSLFLAAVCLLGIMWTDSQTIAQNPAPAAAKNPGNLLPGQTPCHCCASCQCQKKPAAPTGNGTTVDAHVECKCCGGKPTATAVGAPPVVILFATLLELPNRWLKKGDRVTSDECQNCQNDSKKFRDEVEKLKGTAARLEGERIAAVDDNDRLKTRIDASKLHVSDLEASLKGAEQAATALRQERDEARKHLAETECQLQAERAECRRNLDLADQSAQRKLAFAIDQKQKIYEEHVKIEEGRVFVTTYTYLFFAALAVLSTVYVFVLIRQNESGCVETNWGGFGGGAGGWKLSRLAIATLVMLISIGILATFTSQFLEGTDLSHIDARLKDEAKKAAAATVNSK
jgi:hypothetical protein